MFELHKTLRSGMATGVKIHVKYMAIDCGLPKPRPVPTVEIQALGLDKSHALPGDCFVVAAVDDLRCVVRP